MSELLDLLRTAQWIWPGHRLADLYNVFALFRRDVVLATVPSEAPLAVTADQGYRLWINGRYVTRGPARGYQAHWPYDQFDIASFLVPGKNIFAVEVYNPGHSTYSYISQNSAGLLLAARIGATTVVSDASWLCRYETGRKRDTALFSRQLFHQEHIGGHRYDRRWIESPRPPRGWERPETAVFGSMPWHALEERGTPQLREVRRTPKGEVSRARGATKPGYRSWRNVTEGLSGVLKEVEWTLTPPEQSSGHQGTWSLPAAGAGYFQAVILDFGETVVGPVSLSVSQGQAQAVLDLFFFEMLEEGGSPTIPFPAFCEVSLSNRLVLRSGSTACDFFHLLGFRYVLVLIHETASPVTFDLTVSDTGYPYRETGQFRCSDPLLNRIWQVCRRTQQVCSLDSYVDTPWREQAQWWGDCNVQFRNTLTMDWDPRLMRRGLISIIRQQTPNGLTYGNAPTMAHQCILPDYSLSWLVFLYEYYSRTGDRSVFDDYQEAISRLLHYFEQEAPRFQGLLSHDPRYWLFLDWSDLEKGGTPTLYSLWYLYALRLTARMFRVTGRVYQALDLQSQAQTLETQLLAQTYDEAVGLFHDGFDAHGERLSTYSVHVQTMALLLNLKPEAQETMLHKRLLPFLRGEPIQDPKPSAYWTTFVLSAVRSRGYASLVMDFIRRRWEPMVDHGTTFEVFGPDETIVAGEASQNMSANWGNFSASHAWTAHPLFHLTEILGGVTEVPESTKISYCPWFEPGIEFVEVTVPHSQGEIRSSWRRTDGRIDLRLILPPGVSAQVQLRQWEGVVEGVFQKTLTDESP